MTRLFLTPEVPDRLRTESDKLRLIPGTEGLKGTSPARLTAKREREE